MEKSMKKVTLILWVIIFGFIALFIFQNQTFFLTQNAFNLNLGIRDYPIPELHNAVLVLVFFCSGLIIAYLFNISARFKAKRRIKKLNLSITSQLNEMAELRSEINVLKGVEAPVDGLAATTKLDLNASPKNAAETTAGSTVEKTAKINADATTSHPVDDDDTGNFEIEEKY